MNDRKPALNLSWLIVLGLLGYGIYGAGMRINYYADDFQWYFDPPPSSIFHYFWHRNPYEPQAYRPLQASFLIFVQRFWGMNTFPIHLTQVVLHVLLSWLIWLWMINYGFTRLQAVLGSLFMLMSQANAMAVLSVDTISQVSSALFGCVSLWLLCYPHDISKDSREQSHRTIHRRYYILSIFTFVLALLSKETGIAFFGMAFCILLYKNAKAMSRFLWLRRTIIEIIPLVIIIAIYFGIRSMLELKGPTLSSSRYGLHFGLNIIQNFCMFIFQTFLPASSVDAFVAFKSREIFILSMIIVGWLIFVGAVAYGLLHVKRYYMLSLMSMCAIISLFPPMLIKHVSELYLYNAMPFFACLVGAGLGKLIDLTKEKRVLCGIVVISIALILNMNILAIQDKARLMTINGEKAELYLSRIIPYLEEVDQGHELLLLNPMPEGVEYSVFLMSGFNVLRGGLNRIRQLSKRADLRIEIIPQSEIEFKQLPHNALILQLGRETGDVTRIH